MASVKDYDHYADKINSPMEGVLFLDDVLFQLKITKSTLYRLIGESKFPRPGRYHSRSTWKQEQVDTYLKEAFGAQRAASV